MMAAPSAGINPPPANHTWLTLQCCLNQIIKTHGGNEYKIDHMLKVMLEHSGGLLDVKQVVVEEQQPLNTSKITNEDTEDTEIMTCFY